MVKKYSIWILAFSLIFLATQDYLFISNWPDTLWMGLPVWLFYFIGIHILFIVAIYRLSVTRENN